MNNKEFIRKLLNVYLIYVKNRFYDSTYFILIIFFTSMCKVHYNMLFIRL